MALCLPHVVHKVSADNDAWAEEAGEQEISLNLIANDSCFEVGLTSPNQEANTINNSTVVLDVSQNTTCD